MDLRKGKQEEEVMVSSEVESTVARQTRPAERAKEKELEERENVKAKGERRKGIRQVTNKTTEEAEKEIKGMTTADRRC